MPRLPKFKDFHISPLAGPMNTATPIDLLPNGQFRYVKNFRVDGAGKLIRAGGFKALLDDGNYDVGGAIKNNSDLHDQLGSKESPTNTTREHITMLYEFESGGGVRKLVAGTSSRLYALNQRSRNWVLIGDNLGSGYGTGISADYETIKFKAAQLGNNIVFTNNYNEPLYWFFDTHPDKTSKELVQVIPDLGKLKITKAAFASEYKGFLFLGDLEEDGAQQSSKVQWSDYIDATSYYPSLSSLAGQQTVGDFGESIIGMAVLGDHLMIYKERSIWRCSLVSSSNLFVFKQVYQGENTPFYPDTLVNVGGAHFYMAERGIYRITISDVAPVRVDWMHNASGLIYQEGETITGEDGGSVSGGIKDMKITQVGTIAEVSSCTSRPPSILAHPNNLSLNANPCSASYTPKGVFGVTVTGKEPFSYQWQKKLTSSSTWADIANEKKASLTLKNPQAPDVSGQEYRVVITNDDGTTTSNAATLSLSSSGNVPTFTSISPGASKNEGESHTFTVKYCDAVTSVQWRKDVGSCNLSQYTDKASCEGDPEGTWDEGTPENITHDGTKYFVENGMVEPFAVPGYYYSKLTIKSLVSADSETYDLQATNDTGPADSGNMALTVSEVSVITVDEDTGEEGVEPSNDNLSFIIQPQPYYELYSGENIGQHYRVGEGYSKPHFRGGYTAITRDGKKLPQGHKEIVVKVSGGKKPYRLEWKISPNTGGIKINNSGGYTDAYTGEIKVDRMGSGYKKGTVIEFANSATITLTEDAFPAGSGPVFPDTIRGTVDAGSGTEIAHQAESLTTTRNWSTLGTGRVPNGHADGAVYTTLAYVRFYSTFTGAPESDNDQSELNIKFGSFGASTNHCWTDSFIKCFAKDSSGTPQTALSDEVTVDIRVGKPGGWTSVYFDRNEEFFGRD